MLPFKVSSLYEPLNLAFIASQKAKPEAFTSCFFFFFFFLRSCSHFLGPCPASNWLVKFNHPSKPSSRVTSPSGWNSPLSPHTPCLAFSLITFSWATGLSLSDPHFSPLCLGITSAVIFNPFRVADFFENVMKAAGRATVEGSLLYVSVRPGV